jgi:hypothetical protein
VSTVDYAAGLIGWPLFLLGLALIAGGVFGLAWIFRDQLGYDEPEIPPVVEPDPDRTVILSAVMPAPNYHRDDDDTQVIRPHIPGATPEERTEVEPAELAPFLEAVDEMTVVLADATGVPRELLARPGVSAWETFEQIPGLRVIEHGEEPVTDELLTRVRDGLRGPVCPTCGGPFGNCSCYGQKSAPKESDATQVVDLCPLTTHEFEVPVATGEPPLFAETFERHPSAELGTQELSGSLARAKECAA